MNDAQSFAAKPAETWHKVRERNAAKAGQQRRGTKRRKAHGKIDILMKNQPWRW